MPLSRAWKIHSPQLGVLTSSTRTRRCSRRCGTCGPSWAPRAASRRSPPQRVCNVPADDEELTNALIAVVWPYLDQYPDDRDGVESAFRNALDSWSP